MNDRDADEIMDILIDVKLELTKYISRGFHNLGKMNNGHGKKNLFRTLFILYKKGPLTPSELSQLMDLRKSTMTAIIDFLTDNNFVSVECGKDDRRKKIVCLTDKGFKQAQKRKEIIRHIITESFKQLDNSDIEELLIHLNGIKDVLSRLDR